MPARISEVLTDSIAEELELNEGDELISIDGITSPIVSSTVRPTNSGREGDAL